MRKQAPVCFLPEGTDPILLGDEKQPLRARTFPPFISRSNVSSPCYKHDFLDERLHQLLPHATNGAIGSDRTEERTEPLAPPSLTRFMTQNQKMIRSERYERTKLSSARYPLLNAGFMRPSSRTVSLIMPAVLFQRHHHAIIATDDPL